MIYWTVPNEPVPWPAIWPGALAATLAIGAVDYAFPFYLSNINDDQPESGRRSSSC